MRVNFDFEGPINEMEKMLEKLKELQGENDHEFTDQIRELEEKVRKRREEIYANLTPWQTVQIARHQQRPGFRDYIDMIFTDFIELHGDRRIMDDLAMIGGFARLGNDSVMLIGHNKGRTLEERGTCRFGSPNPEGYRKAFRLFGLAEKFNVPVICFIDTQGAFPGREAEERGQAEAIAANLVKMARLEVPIICIVTGEGGSGGALGIGVGDIILMLSHSIYSVISPEGCAGILWRDGSFAEQAAEALKLTAPSLKALGVIDEIVDEPTGGAQNDPHSAALAIKKALMKYLKKLQGQSPSKLVQKRFEKFSAMGQFNN